MAFIFAETQALQSAAADTADLAADTVSTGAHGQAAGAVVVPPGLDPISAQNAAHLKAYLARAAADLAAGAGLQDVYSTSVSNAANIYALTDQLNAVALGGLF